MTSDLVASSSITHQPKNLRYDVFLSFRRDDTCDNFVSHVHKALSDHQIKTFIDYNLSKGDDFPAALFTAIEESLISIIIFSENYADSTWCLKELAKIMECKNSNEQIVLPVFYGVYPSQVRNQTGNFGAAFDWLQECSKGKMNFDKARYHLMEVANISGWDSHVIRSESQLITGIVGDVLHKLNLFSLSYSTNLVGVFPHIEKVESLLCLDSLGVSVVGIWGMGGIGKSTIARMVFNHICHKFDASHFVSNLQDELKRQSLDTVRESLLLKIFEKECLTMGTHSLVPDFIRRQLPQKKVLIVLDDVNDPIQVKELLEGKNYLFGSGSKILITSRDRQVLKSVTNKIHTMEAMNEKDAMTLFSLNAFKQKYPTNSYIELSKRAIYYADGNPLALVVLGSALFDRSKESWVSALEGLEKEAYFDIKNVLRSSYDTLSPGEKEIFLDNACFLFGKCQDFINQYYDNLEIFKKKTLEDKCPVPISSSNTIKMHDLLKEISRIIDVRRFPDISFKSLKLQNLSWISEVPSSIQYLYGLKFLKMNDCRKLSTISTNICKLKLESFPEILESISFSFLKELHLGGNNCEMLPENMDQLANLQYLNVSASERLRFVPKLPSSLQTLYAECCVSLESISIGVRGNKLKSLLLTNCFKLQDVTRNQILAHSHFMMTQLAEDYKFYVLPGTEIPEWMGMGVGSCVTIKFPTSHDIEYWSQFRGFGFCVVFSAISPQYKFNFQCILKQNDHVISRLGIKSFLIKPVTEHLFMWRCIDDRVSELDLNELMGKEVSFEFSMFEVLTSPEGSFDVLKCGVQLLFENTAPRPTSLISSATNTEDDQLLISASSSIPPSPEKPTVEIKLTGMELSELPKAEEWKVSKLIHLNDSQLLKLPENPSCPVLEDLSLKGNSKIRTIPPLFFDSMPALGVLDLSRTRIKSLPDSLFSLPKLKRLFLKHCNLLMKLSPKVGQLKGLQVLDLEGTEIMNLPEEVKELENLMCLKVSFCELPSYRRVEEPDVLMISPGTLSALPLLEELSINVSPDDGRWNECVEHVVSEVSGLALLYKLQFYFPSMEFLSRFKWSRIKAFKLTAGPLAAKRLMPRLPSDAEAELERCDKSFTSVHGHFESEMNNPVLQHADALFLDRHTTMRPLSTFGLDSFKHIRCCVVGECNELQVLFCAGQKPPHVSLEYLYLYYMKSLRHVWEGRLPPMVHLKSLALRTCPMLSSIFSEDLIGSLNSLKSLQEIIIDDCPAIINLVRCNGFECTSSGGTAHNNFLPSLKRISLHYLPQLRDIFDLSRSRDLEWMSIYHCPNLKSLPIDTTSNENLKKIMGERSWWESLEWQDTKQHSWDDVFVEQELCY